MAGAVGGSPIANDVVLLASELATNAVRHTASGDGGTFWVVIRMAGKWVCVTVRDDGSNAEALRRTRRSRACRIVRLGLACLGGFELALRLTRAPSGRIGTSECG